MSGLRRVMVLPLAVENHVAESNIVIGRRRTANDRAGAMFAVESAGLHPMAHGGVERAAAFLGQHQRKLHRFIEDSADRDRCAGAGAKLHELAARIKARATGFDLVKPPEGAVDGGSIIDAFAGADNFNAHQRPHYSLRRDRHQARRLLRLAQGFHHREIERVGALGRAGNIVHVGALPLGHLRRELVDYGAGVASAALRDGR